MRGQTDEADNKFIRSDLCGVYKTVMRNQTDDAGQVSGLLR